MTREHIEAAGMVTGRVLHIVRQFVPCQRVQVMALGLAIGRIAERAGIDIEVAVDCIRIGWRESAASQRNMH
jgi:hypothetical protein